MTRPWAFTLASLLLVATRSAQSDPLHFNGCSATQKSTLVDQFLLGQTLAVDALNYMQNHADEHPEPFKKWFDANFLGANRAVVALGFERIVEGIAKDFDVDCTGTGSDCVPMRAAYVDATRSQPGERMIYFCAPYWNPLTFATFGTQAGIFVHEMSHFITIANTNDYDNAKTPDACHALAATDPNTAIQSAYNFEFFAEDHPLAGGAGGCVNCRLGTRPSSAPFAFFVLAALLLIHLRRRWHRREMRP